MQILHIIVFLDLLYKTRYFIKFHKKVNAVLNRAHPQTSSASAWVFVWIKSPVPGTVTPPAGAPSLRLSVSEPEVLSFFFLITSHSNYLCPFFKLVNLPSKLCLKGFVDYVLLCDKCT